MADKNFAGDPPGRAIRDQRRSLSQISRLWWELAGSGPASKAGLGMKLNNVRAHVSRTIRVGSHAGPGPGQIAIR